MKSFTSAVLLLAGLATASPVQTRQEQGPYEVSSFSASKIHNSGTCNFAFDVSTHGIAEPAHCTASADAGFSGATYLALIYEGLGKCDNADVTWTFYQPSAVETAPPKDATLNVTINGVRGTYIIPGSDITASLNDKENPFDNDVAYTGPKAFSITKFVRVEEEA